jgi:glucan biosynthesis protein C
LLSGASTWFALRHRTSRQFITERFTRLFIPLIAGIILIAPFQAYFEAISNSLYNGTLLQFYPLFLESIRVSWNPQWLGAYTHHLWFLADLFLFSLITLPVCLLLKREVGKRFIHRLAEACERRSGLLVLVLPIAFIQVTLRASFPGYQNWSDVFCWLMFYLYGYILFANPRFRRAIQQQGRMALCLGSACFLLLIGLWIAGVLGPWTKTPNYSIGCLLFQVLDSVTTWSWLIVILNVASKWLNFSNNVLPYGNRATLPFYLLHFPVVVIIAYYVLPWHANVLVAFLLISTSSLIVTLALADLLYIRMSGILALFRQGSNECDSLLRLHIRNHALQAIAHLIWAVQTVTSLSRFREPCLRMKSRKHLVQQKITGLPVQTTREESIDDLSFSPTPNRVLTGSLA